MRRPVIVLAVVLLALPLGATSASSSEPAVVPVGHAPVAPTVAAPTVSVTIPDLSRALTGSAPAGVRRAACHQLTGLDDESLPALAACLAG